MLIYTPPTPPTVIPLVDLGGSFGSDAPARRAAADAIHRACRETGFFYVANHGLPAGLVDAQFAAAQGFFDLPLAVKQRIHMSNSATASGYEPVGGQVLDSQDDKADKAPPDLKESFYCGRELAPDDPLTQPPRRGLGHNQWPDLPGFREQAIAYHAAMCGLGNHLLGLIALSLDMPTDWFARFFEAPSAMLRLIKYPPQPSSASFNQIGAGAHTDWGGITILAQDESGGLEVQNLAGDWIEATPIPGSFVINLGDLMARWTNGLYNSNMHRVKNNRTGRDRYSVPFFVSPNFSTVLAPLPQFTARSDVRAFEPVHIGNAMTSFFRSLWPSIAV